MGCRLRVAMQSMLPDVEMTGYLDGLEIFKDLEDSLLIYLFMSKINVNFANDYFVAVSNREDLMIGVVGVEDIFDDACDLFFLFDRNCWK